MIPIRPETLTEIDRLIKSAPLKVSIKAFKMLEHDLAMHAKSLQLTIKKKEDSE